MDTKVVAHKDLEITIKSNGEKVGSLLISKGNIEWLPKGHSVNKRRMSWWKFAKVMEEHGRAVKAKR
ncbi:MAG: hypothetical protein IT180_18825 [Acidobacteria bacterium]|nr:hypothetical protein [Acidobacteriota bacterium]